MERFRCIYCFLFKLKSKGWNVQLSIAGQIESLKRCDSCGGWEGIQEVLTLIQHPACSRCFSLATAAVFVPVKARGFNERRTEENHVVYIPVVPHKAVAEVSK